jgi:2-polyprenyl-3-methyl-5-hydroxy-6-metoxy-1,4-benzoquinol methylase
MYYDTRTLYDRWNDISVLNIFKISDMVLDIGCAEGLVTNEISKNVRCVEGVDINSDRVNCARNKYKHIKFSNVDIVKISFRPFSYDVITFLGVYHHIAKGIRDSVLTGVLSAAKRVVLIRTPLEGKKNILKTIQSNNYDYKIMHSKNENVGDLIICTRIQSD